MEGRRGSPRKRYPHGPLPTFLGGEFRENPQLAERVREITSEKGAAPGQPALAWLLARGDDIVQVPGAKRRERQEENAAEVGLRGEDLDRIEEAPPKDAAAGERYTERMMRAVNR